MMCMSLIKGAKELLRSAVFVPVGPSRSITVQQIERRREFNRNIVGGEYAAPLELG